MGLGAALRPTIGQGRSPVGARGRGRGHRKLMDFRQFGCEFSTLRAFFRNIFDIFKFPFGFFFIFHKQIIISKSGFLFQPEIDKQADLTLLYMWGQVSNSIFRFPKKQLDRKPCIFRRPHHSFPSYAPGSSFSGISWVYVCKGERVDNGLIVLSHAWSQSDSNIFYSVWFESHCGQEFLILHFVAFSLFLNFDVFLAVRLVQYKWN